MNVLHEATYLGCFMKVKCTGLKFTTTSLDQTEAYKNQINLVIRLARAQVCIEKLI